MSTKTILLPAEHLLTLTVDAVGAGSLVRLADSAGEEPFAPVVVTATVSFGPFATPRRYRLRTDTGSIVDTKTPVLATGNTAHSDLTGLADDGHTQYALLAGRSGGQTIIGGTDASDNLELTSTSDATKGKIIIDGTLTSQKNIATVTTETGTGTTLITTDYEIATGTITRTLPTVATAIKPVTIKNKGSGVITVNTSDGANIESTTLAVISAGDSLTFVSDGTDWWVV